jgi:carboxynorspermidine decarboxylase
MVASVRAPPMSPTLRTPYYLLDESRLVDNLRVVDQLRARTGTKSLLALKCFATWPVFGVLSQHLAGTTSSSVNEARLGHDKFGGETHAYSVAFSADEVSEVAGFADKVIFNSASQLRAYHHLVDGPSVGVRVNPGISHSHFDLADPARRYSRLGIVDPEMVAEVSSLVDGVMFHFNCENTDAAAIARSLSLIADRYATVLPAMKWVSLGGGVSFTTPGFDLDVFCDALDSFADRFQVQLYLEPGEAVITQAAELVTTVLDVIRNEKDVAIIDASLEAHMLDHLVYGTTPQLSWPEPGEHEVIVAGRTCLAGDVFGEHRLATPLRVGDEVRIADAAGYTMVKKNWFNGVTMPSIVVRRLDGRLDVVRQFNYDDYVSSLG